MHINFRGGAHPKGNKELAKDRALTQYLPKGDLVYPLGQHIGKPAAPVVKKGDPVLVGQKIAEADGFVSASIYSGASGKVKAIEPRMTSGGVMAQCIVIENDGEFRMAEGIGEKTDWQKLDNAEILRRVREAGVVGLGGAGFPTHVKLAPKDPFAIEYIVANGSECESYITCDDRLMREHTDDIVEGLRIVLRLFPNAKGVIAIEDNKPEAIRAMEEATRRDDNIKVLKLKTKYPQGGERNLVYAVTGKRMASRDLPANLGCIVDNVATLAAICRAVVYSEPLFEKAMTVTGDGINQPSNFFYRIGTSINEVIEAAGGMKPGVKKIILGGPMMGTALSSTDVPLTKANNAVICMMRDEVEEAEAQQTNCIHCGLCVRSCPLGLFPQLMADAAKHKDFERYQQLHGMDCIACGTCAFVCPAKRPLTQTFKQTKGAILAEQAKNRGAK